MCISLACDVRIAAKDAKLGFTFANLNLHPGMGCTYFLPSIAGPQVAARLLLSGDIFSGTDAMNMGIVSQTADSGAEALDEAVNLASRMAAAGPLAVQSCTATLRAKQDAGLQAALQREADAQAVCYMSADYSEGIRAVSEVRPPVFSGN